MSFTPTPPQYPPATRSSNLRWVLGCIGVSLVGILVIAGVGGYFWYRSYSANNHPAYFGKIVPPKGQVLRYVVDNEVETLDPQLPGSGANAQVITALFDGLAEWDSAGRTIPSLATRWETNSDSTVWTFHLRQGAKWTDGTPITAQDFVSSWKRALAPESEAINASLLFYLKDGATYHQGTAKDIGVTALGDYTLQVTLAEPAPYFDKLLPLPIFRPVPHQAIASWGDTWATPEHIVTSGAFKLSAWKPKEQLVVERNQMFWDNAHTRLDQITFLPRGKDALDEALNLYEKGEVDVAPVTTREKREQVRNKKDFLFSSSAATIFLAINPSVKPLDDVRVRRALSMAIDRKALTADSHDLNKPLTSFVPSLEGYEAVVGSDFNPEEAQRLLKEAGYPGGRGFPDIELSYSIAGSNKKLAELVQTSLQKELGIKLKLNGQELRTFLGNRDFNGLARRGWIPDYPDPYAYLQTLMAKGANNTGWTDEKYDKLLAQANVEANPIKRAALLRSVEVYMLAQQPVIPLYSGFVSLLCKPYVKNLVPNLSGQPDWRSIFIDQTVTAQSLRV